MILTIFKEWLYSIYPVCLCLFVYIALLVWLYYVLFENSFPEGSFGQILHEKFNQIMSFNLSVNSKNLKQITLEKNTTNES